MLTEDMIEAVRLAREAHAARRCAKCRAPNVANDPRAGAILYPDRVDMVCGNCSAALEADMQIALPNEITPALPER